MVCTVPSFDHLLVYQSQRVRAVSPAPNPLENWERTLVLEPDSLSVSFGTRQVLVIGVTVPEGTFSRKKVGR